MPYTPTTWVENVTTLGPTNMNHIEQGLALTSPAYGTTLPGSPADGQEAILVDSTTNASYQWRFRYNAGSSSAYKWEFVGGSPLTNAANSGAGNGSGTFALDSASQTVAPRAGNWLVRISGRLNVPATPGNTLAQAACYAGGATNICSEIRTSTGGAVSIPFAGSRVFAAVAASASCGAAWANGSGDGATIVIGFVTVELLPVRVS